MTSIKIFSRHLLSLCFIVLFIFSCENDDNRTNSNDPQGQDPDPTTFAQNFGNDITRTFLGNVFDSNGNPLEGVLIKIGSLNATTDSNGVFILQDAPVKERFGYITAEKSGFIHASRAVVPSVGANNIRIMMLPETVAGTTASGTQETISLSNGASVSLEGDYIKPDGSDYSGSVNVILHHLDPVDENMPDQMPGMLYAANAQNEERMLQTFGMLAVELRGSNGEDLNLAEGSSAEIRVPLDPSLMGNAPGTIPLWYFDEVNGYWIEDGQATLVGNEYVGTVTHFSFWNCDVPAEAITLCINVSTNNSDLQNMSIFLTSSTFGTTNGFTGGSGQACGYVPSGESLAIEVFAPFFGNDCSDGSVYSGTIGPFDTDDSIDVEITDFGDLILETVTGQFNDCDNNPVSSGYVALNYLGVEQTDDVTGGNFDISLLRCPGEDTFYIQGYDFINIQQTDSLAYTFITPLTNIGNLQACNIIDEFITYQLDGSPVISYNFDINASISGNTLNISHSNPNDLAGESYFNLYIPNFSGVGAYSDGYLDYFDENNNSTSLETQFFGDFNVTSFGDVGEHIDINFNGVVTDWNNPEDIPITGSIHVFRDF